MQQSYIEYVKNKQYQQIFLLQPSLNICDLEREMREHAGEDEYCLKMTYIEKNVPICVEFSFLVF